MSTLKRLWDEHRQAVWLDFIDRRLLEDGTLVRLVEEDGLRGVTSNPSIFEKAMVESGQYDDAIDALLAERPGLSTGELYEELAVSDIRAAADVLRPVWEASDAGDGFVSLEVSPHLALDTAGTVEEAQRLWRRVDRPNLMIKVPATAPGLPAVELLLAGGINVNVTLMFSLAHYDAVARAYLRGAERCQTPERLASVASFFVSRVDTAVDRTLEEIGTEEALKLRGAAAVANAALAYRRFEEIFHGDEFRPLAARGARVQRPLWASTSTKNPAYRDVKYVEELIAPETVNTLPTATVDAFRDHGRPRAGLAEAAPHADEVVGALEGLGIDLGAVTERLQVEGVDSFARSFDTLMARLDGTRAAHAAAR